MSDWTKIDREKTDSTKVDRAEGWFRGRWFYDWLSGILWRIVNREKGDWTKINRE